MISKQLMMFFLNSMSDENYKLNGNSRRNKDSNDILYNILRVNEKDMDITILENCCKALLHIQRHNKYEQVTHGNSAKPFMVYDLIIYAVNLKLAYQRMNRIRFKAGLARPGIEDMSTSSI